MRMTRTSTHPTEICLQRLAMEITDGVFIQPLIGWKKCGDFAPTAIVSTYREMIDKFYGEVQEMGGSRWDTSSLIKRFRK